MLVRFLEPHKSFQEQQCAHYIRNVPRCPMTACDNKLCQKCKDWEAANSNDDGAFLVVDCNWSHQQRISGLNSHDDYHFNCTKNKLIGATKNRSSCSMAEVSTS
eukprot:14872817-Ditylum_brightwellii.AAC.1